MPGEHRLLLFLGELKNQWLLGAIIFFVLSLFMGAVKGGNIPWIYPVLWAFFGLLFIFCIIKAFPDVWHLLLPVSGVYIFSLLAIVCFEHMDSFSNWFLLISGLSLEGLGVWGVSITIFTVANRRDEMMEVWRYLNRQSGGERSTHVPMGLWSLSVVLIFFISNISMWYWSDYGTSGSFKSYIGYIVSELVLLILLIYFFWVPQNKLDYSYDKDVVTEVKRNPIVTFFQRFSLTRRQSPIATRLPLKKKVRKRSVKCPDCGHKLVMERRKCPHCSRVKRFGWCPGSEDFIVNCPKCRNLVALSPGKCKRCGQAISGTIECTCGKITELDSWELAAK